MTTTSPASSFSLIPPSKTPARADFPSPVSTAVISSRGRVLRLCPSDDALRDGDATHRRVASVIPRGIAAVATDNDGFPPPSRVRRAFSACRRAVRPVVAPVAIWASAAVGTVSELVPEALGGAVVEGVVEGVVEEVAEGVVQGVVEGATEKVVEGALEKAAEVVVEKAAMDAVTAHQLQVKAAWQAKSAAVASGGLAGLGLNLTKLAPLLRRLPVVPIGLMLFYKFKGGGKGKAKGSNRDSKKRW
uniref:Uncharacterized protein n=1 Tax=Corethron hystrix TaxID=216773 RepID=A0A7S1FVT3_9STRA